MFVKKDIGGKKKISPVSPLAGVCKPSKPKKTPPFIHQSPEQDYLIDVKKFELPKSPVRLETFDELDKLLLDSPIIEEKASASEEGEGNRKDKKGASTASSLKLKESLPLVPLSSFTRKEKSSLAGVIVGQRYGRAKTDATREKYKDQEFSIPRSKKLLKSRIEKYMDVVPRLLAGKEDLSIFYNLAHEQCKSSPHTTMTQKENFEIPFQKYIAGFYGLKRQNFVASLIQAQHGDLLRKCRNKTVVYWSPELFITYVLANELILRLVMEDKKISKLRAESLLQKTTDYGVYMADDIEFADDLAFDELAIIKDTSKQKKQEKKASRKSSC